MIAFLLALKSLVLRLGQLLLRDTKKLVELRLIIALSSFSDRQRVNSLKSAVVGNLKYLLLLLKLVDSLSADLILLLKCKLCQHSVLFLFVQPLQFLLLLVNRKSK